MYFIIDTCFLLHAIDLKRREVIDLSPQLKKCHLAITHDLLKEIENYTDGSFIDIREFTILATPKTKCNQFKRKYEYLEYFDKADQGIWISSINTDNIVLTDDGALYEELIQLGVRTYRLPSFLLLLVDRNKLNKNEARRCLKYWEDNSLYKIKDLKKWKKQLNKIA